MPAVDHVDPTLLDEVAARLARSSKATLEASHELLAHYSDTGDTPTQRAVDALVDQVAAALGRLTDSLTDVAKGLEASGRLAAAPADEVDVSPTRGGKSLARGEVSPTRGDDVSPARTGPGRGHVT